VHIFLEDVTGDGLLDAYVSSLSSTLWQVIFYQNTGTSSAHHMEYLGPVVAAGGPLDIFYRTSTEPNISGTRPFVASADMDQNSLSDVLLSTAGGEFFGAPTILWNFPDSPLQTFAYRMYTFSNGAGRRDLWRRPLCNAGCVVQAAESVFSVDGFDWRRVGRWAACRPIHG
jgi:hypothetical protein